MTEHHSIVPHDAWIEARQQLLAKEKAFNRLRDELSAERRALPHLLDLLPEGADGWRPQFAYQ